MIKIIKDWNKTLFWFWIKQYNTERERETAKTTRQWDVMDICVREGTLYNTNPHDWGWSS